MKIRKVEKSEAGTGEITMDYAEKTFKELLAFQGYGFCLGYDVPVCEKTKGVIPIGELHVGDFILTPGDSGVEKWEEVLNILLQGEKDVFSVEFDNGRKLHLTLDHPLKCEDGILRDVRSVFNAGRTCRVMFRGMQPSAISNIIYIGLLPVLDISISGSNHLFYADDCIVHNCKAHATSYSVYSAVQMWLQEHYFTEYMCALLCHIDRAKEKKGVGVLNERVEYCVKHGMSIYYPDVTRSSSKWEIVGGGLLAPLKNIKGFSDREVSKIEEGRPYADLRDFLDKTGFNEKRFEQLLFANAFHVWGDVPTLYEWYYNDYAKKDGKKKEDEQFSLFDEPQEEQSSAPRILMPYSKVELEEKCLDLNGFVVQDNIRIKYSEFFKRGLVKVAEIKHNEDYAVGTRKIRTLEEAEALEVDEDKYKNFWVLAKVMSEARGLPGKYGTFDKVVIGDGFTSVTLTGKVPSILKRGSVVIFPVSKNSNGKLIYDRSRSEKLDPVVLE